MRSREVNCYMLDELGCGFEVINNFRGQLLRNTPWYIGHHFFKYLNTGPNRATHGAR